MESSLVCHTNRTCEKVRFESRVKKSRSIIDGDSGDTITA